MIFSIKKKIGKMVKARRDAKEWPVKLAYFSDEYSKAKEYYASKETITQSSFDSPSDLLIHHVIPGQVNNTPFTLPENYLAIVNELSSVVDERLKESKNVSFALAEEKFTRQLEAELVKHARTEDMPLVKDGRISKLFLKNTTDIAVLEKLASVLVPLAEKLYYHSYVWVEKAALLRSIGNQYPDKKSTLWHTDNHYESITKIMVYLNDIGEKDAPFEYLRHKETHEVVRIKANMPQFYPGGRVPLTVIDDYLSRGYERFKVLGPKGTTIFFDDKIIHKGNEPEDGHHRDALILQLRPATEKPASYILPGKTTAS